MAFRGKGSEYLVSLQFPCRVVRLKESSFFEESQEILFIKNNNEYLLTTPKTINNTIQVDFPLLCTE